MQNRLLVLARCHAGNAAEAATEMALIGETEAESHLSNLDAMVQHRLCVEYAQQQLIAMRGDAQRCREQPRETELTQPGYGGKIIQLDTPRVISAQMGSCPLDGQGASPGDTNRLCRLQYHGMLAYQPRCFATKG